MRTASAATARAWPRSRPTWKRPEAAPDAVRAALSAARDVHGLQRAALHHVPDRDGGADGVSHLGPVRSVVDPQADGQPDRPADSTRRTGAPPVESRHAD